MRRTLWAALVATACSLSAAPVKIHGYITSLKSPASFQIDDYQILSGGAALELDKGDYADASFAPEDLRVGTEVEVTGDVNDATRELHATSVKVFVNDSLRLKRSAVIERETLLERDGNSLKGVIRTDGQTLQVNEDTHVVVKDFQSPNLTPGMSIAYEGYRNRDGLIIATRLEIFEGSSGRPEPELWRDSTPKLTGDGGVWIRGVKYELVPDADAQRYIQRLGTKLVPSYYQHELAGGAARKPPFEFFLVANDDFNAHAFPNGTVLVNSGVFRVLTTEAQLAAVLGHEIAHATQEHAYRELQHRKKKGGADLQEKGYAGDNPPSSGSDYSRILENQADRVGLGYMVAAGYDPREAPEVWKQVARAAGRAGGFWNGQDDFTARRSYLLAELNENYSGVDYQSYVRDGDEFDRLAQRFGNQAALKQAPGGPAADSPSDRPGPVAPAAPKAAAEKRYGPNSVNITSEPAGADVLLNGNPIGKTPMILPTVNIGLPYTITVQRTGYRSWTGQMVAVPGKTSLRVELLSEQ